MTDTMPKKKPRVPPSLKPRQLFHVEKGSFYNHPNHRRRIDENGNLTGRHLMLYSVPGVWRKQIAKGLLVDVTKEFSVPVANAAKLAKERATEASKKAQDESAAKQKQAEDAKIKEDEEKAEAERVIVENRVAAAIAQVQGRKSAGKQSARKKKIQDEIEDGKERARALGGDAALVKEGEQAPVDEIVETAKKEFGIPLTRTPLPDINPGSKRKPGRPKGAKNRESKHGRKEQ